MESIFVYQRQNCYYIICLTVEIIEFKVVIEKYAVQCQPISTHVIMYKRPQQQFDRRSLKRQKLTNIPKFIQTLCKNDCGAQALFKRVILSF